MKYSEKEVEAFLLYTSNKDIAKAIGKSTRTVIKLKKNEALQNEVKKRREEALKGTINKLQGGLSEAVDVLNEIIKDTSIKPQIRLNAISYLLSACKPMIESYYQKNYAIRFDDIINDDPLSESLEELARTLISDPVE